MAQILQAMLDDRKRRDAELVAERKRQEENMAKLLTSMGDSTRRLTSEMEVACQLNKLTEEDDIKAYLTTFERLMEGYRVDRDRWSYRLAPNLTGKAQQAFAALHECHRTCTTDEGETGSNDWVGSQEPRESTELEHSKILVRPECQIQSSRPQTRCWSCFLLLQTSCWHIACTQSSIESAR